MSTLAVVAPSSPDPVAGGSFDQLLTGARASLAGFRFALSEPRVRAWTAAAIMVYVALWSAALVAAAAWDDRAVHALLWPRGPAWWEGALHTSAEFLLYLVYWIAVVVLTFVVALPAVSPLFAFVAEATENAYFGDAIAHHENVASLVRELLRSVVRSLLLVAIHLSGAAIIWLIGMVLSLLLPPVAPFISVLVGGAWSSIWIAMAAISYVLENNRATLAAQLSLLNEQPMLMLGFGMVAQFMAWFPLTAPVVVVSSTLLACRMHEHGHCDLPLRGAATGRS